MVVLHRLRSAGTQSARSRCLARSSGAFAANRGRSRRCATGTHQPNRKCVRRQRQFSARSIIDAALADYRSVLDGGGRHHGFFNAIRKIYVDAGVPLHELRPYMARCDYDGHQKKRYDQIIKDLGTGRYGTPKATNMFLAGMASKFCAGLAK